MGMMRDYAGPSLLDKGGGVYRPALGEQLSRGAVELYRALSARQRHLAAHSELARGPDPQPEIGLILKGWAHRYRLLPDGRRQILDVSLPGDLVGLDGFLLARPRDPIMTLTDVTYGTLDHDEFLRLMGDGDIALHVASLLAIDGQRLDDRLTTIGQMVAEEKLSALLIEFYNRLRQRQIISGTSYQFPLTQQQLGDILGMTVVHVNRVLKRLRDQGVVGIKHRVVTIHDMTKLVALASGRPTAGPRPITAAHASD